VRVVTDGVVFGKKAVVDDGGDSGDVERGRKERGRVSRDQSTL